MCPTCKSKIYDRITEKISSFKRKRAVAQGVGGKPKMLKLLQKENRP